MRLEHQLFPLKPIQKSFKHVTSCHIIMSHHHVTSFHDHVDGAQSHGKAHQRPKWPHPRRLAQVVRARVAIGSAVPWHNTRLSKYVKLVKLGSLKISLPCGCKESGHSEYNVWTPGFNEVNSGMSGSVVLEMTGGQDQASWPSH